MSKYTVTPSDQRISFEENEIIVSKTDLKGRITYANHVFCRLAEMSTKELLGQPHSIIRHPDMPRCIFQLLWYFVCIANYTFHLIAFITILNFKSHIYTRFKNLASFYINAAVGLACDRAANHVADAEHG